MKGFLIAIQFLTIIPVRSGITINEADIAKSASAFAIVGLIQGILLVFTDNLAGLVFHQDLATGIVLLVLVLSNGGFHLDGLADTFDAIAAKGDREKKLAIMKDSTIGPVGVIAVVFSLALKYLSLKNLSHMLPYTYYSSLLFMPVLSKWTMVISMFHGKPAREDGLGKIFISRTGLKEVIVSTLLILLILALPKVFLGRYILEDQYLFYSILLVTMYILCRIGVEFFNKKFGGLTGDTLGAISEITEIIFLLMVIAWSRLSF
jgi:adenosylcobinamide-GDP ribazoletransferase